MSFETDRGNRKNTEEALRYCQLGSDSFKNKDFQKSVAYLERSIKLSPSSPKANILLGESLLALKEYSKAEQTLKACIKLLENAGDDKQRDFEFLELYYLSLLASENLRNKEKIDENYNKLKLIFDKLPKLDQQLMEKYKNKINTIANQKIPEEVD